MTEIQQNWWYTAAKTRLEKDLATVLLTLSCSLTYSHWWNTTALSWAAIWKIKYDNEIRTPLAHSQWGTKVLGLTACDDRILTSGLVVWAWHQTLPDRGFWWRHSPSWHLDHRASWETSSQMTVQRRHTHFPDPQKLWNSMCSWF